MEIYFFAAILPVLVLCYYIYKKDVNREPNSVLGKIFFYGCLISIPIVILELFIQYFYSIEETSSFLFLFINIFISVALVEEGFKWLVTKKFGYDSKEFDEIYDVIVYAVFASLGFACVENVLYVFSNGLGNAVMRAFTSIPGHTCFGVMMGYYFSRAKVHEINGRKSEFQRNMVLSIVVPAFFHALYDSILLYAAAIESFSCILLFLLFLCAMFSICFGIVNKVSNMQQKLYNSSQDDMIHKMLSETAQETFPTSSSMKGIHFCSKCGNHVDGCNYCSKCGAKIG